MNAWKIVAVGLMALSSACHSGEIDARANARLADAERSAQHSIDYATCADGARFGPDCGLILRLAASDDFRIRFRDRVCVDKTSEACDEAYRRMIDAELFKRYNSADWDGVAQECDRKPGLCDQGIAYEKLLMGSHNARVQAKYADQTLQIRETQAAEHRAAAARNIEIATAIMGGTVCHSYPNVFGGEDTVCHR